MTRTTVLLVGLGTIARTHLEVLTRFGEVEVRGAVDPATPTVAGVPVFADLAEARDRVGGVDLAVVATPTASHVDLVDSLLTGGQPLVLSEKPLATSTASLRRLVDRHAPDVLARRVKVAHHFAFSPEVEWARSWAQARPGLGPPTRIQSTFNDAYAARSPEHLRSLVSSHVDSMPNQLSIVDGFVDGLVVTGHASRTDRAVTRLEHAGGATILSSNWLAADTSKQTEVEYDGGRVRLRMDHTSMTVVVSGTDVPPEHVAYTGSAGRKEAHYLGLYRALLSSPDDPRLGVDLATRIAGLLEDAESCADDASTTWNEIGAVSPR